MPTVVADLVAKLSADTSQFDAGLSQAQQKLQGLSSGDIAKGVAGGLLATAAFKTAVDGVKGWVDTAADFQTQISGILAVGGQEAIKNADAIRQTALDLGKDTAFSASEAAAGMEELIKAGVPVKDVLGGAAGAALDLSAATGTAVPESATLMATALNVFSDNMSGFSSEGEKAAHIADLFAQTANASAADVRDIGFAFQMSSNVADSFGISVDELTQALGLMSNAGLRGSDAGTSLKQMLLSLLDPTDKQTGMMQSLGLTYDDFYGPDGHFVGLANAAQLLQSHMAGLTDAQKQNALAVLFGSDAYRAAKILTDAGVKGFEEFAAAQQAAGTVQEQAATRLDNFNGAMEQLRGSIETLAIDLGSRFLGPMKSVVQWITRGVNAVLDMDDSVKSAIATFGGLVAAIGTVSAAFVFLGPLLAALVTPVGLIAAGLAAIVAIGVGAWIGDWFGFRDALVPIVHLIETFGKNLQDAFDAARNGLNPITAGFHAAADALRSVTDGNTPAFLRTLADWLDRAGDAALRFGNRFQDIFARKGNPLESAFLALGQGLSRLTGLDVLTPFRQFDHGLKMVLAGVGDFAGAILHGDWQRASNLLAGGLQKVSDAALRLLQSGIDKIKSLDLGKIALDVKDWIAGKIPDVWKWLKDNVGPKLLDLGRVAVAVAGWLKDTGFPNVFAWLKENVLPVGGKALLALGQVAVSVASWAKDTAFPALWDWLTQTALPAGGKKLLDLGNVAVKVLGWTKDTGFPVLWDWLTQTVLPATGKKLLELGQVLVSVASWAVGSLPDLWDWLKTTVTGDNGAPSPGLGGFVGQGGGLDLGSVAVRVGDWLASKDWPSLLDFVTKTAQTALAGGIKLSAVVVSGIQWTLDEGIPNFNDWLTGQIESMLNGGGGTGPMMGALHGQGTEEKIRTSGHDLGAKFAAAVDAFFKNLTIAPPAAQGTADGKASGAGWTDYIAAFVDGFVEGISDEIQRQIGVKFTDIAVPLPGGQTWHIDLTAPFANGINGPGTFAPDIQGSTATLPTSESGGGAAGFYGEGSAPVNRGGVTEIVPPPMEPITAHPATLPPLVTALPNVGSGPGGGDPMAALAQAITNGGPAVQTAFQSVLTNLGTALSTATNQWVLTISTTLGAIGTAVTNGFVTVQNAATSGLQTVSTAFSTSTNQWVLTLSTTMGALATAVGNGTGAVVAAVRGMVDQSAAIIGSGADAAVIAGSDFALGFARGIGSGESVVSAAATRIANAAVDAVKTTIESASPAKKTIAEGQNFSAGFKVGIDRGAPAAIQSAAQLGGAAVDALAGNGGTVAGERSAHHMGYGANDHVGPFAASFAPKIERGMPLPQLYGLDDVFGVDDVLAKRLEKMYQRGVVADRALSRVNEMFGFTTGNKPEWASAIMGLSSYGTFTRPDKDMNAWRPWDFGAGDPFTPGPDHDAAVRSLWRDANSGMLGGRAAAPSSAAPTLPENVQVTVVIDGGQFNDLVLGSAIAPLVAAHDSVGSRGVLSGA